MSYWNYTDYIYEPGGRKKLNYFIDKISSLEKELGLKKEQVRILDIGCGNGNIACPLASIGYNVTGIDENENAIKNAKQRNMFATAKFIKQDVLEADISNQFEVIIASEVLEHIKKPDSLLKVVNQLLSDKGIFLISIPNGFSIEEVVRRFSTHTKIGRGIKKHLRKKLFKKENVQSAADSPHLFFFSLKSFTKVLQANDFCLTDVKNGSLFFKGFFYLLARSFISRKSRLFQILDRIDYILADKILLDLGEDWLISARRFNKA